MQATKDIDNLTLANLISEYLFGFDNRGAVETEVLIGIKRSRKMGLEPNYEELAAYVLQGIGSRESIASYLKFHFEREGEEK